MKRYSSARCISRPPPRRLLGLAAALILTALTFTGALWPPRPNWHCRPPPPGFNTVFCGKDLVGFRGSLFTDLFAVATASPTSQSPPFSFINFLRGRGSPSHSVIIDHLLQENHNSGRILVLGLGGGAIPYLLSERFPQCKIVAIDISPDSLEICRQFVKSDEDNENLEYILDDANDFVRKSPSDSFDIVISDLSGEFRYQRRFFGHLFRLLREGGQVYVHGTAAGDHNRLQETLEEVFDPVSALKSHHLSEPIPILFSVKQ